MSKWPNNIFYLRVIFGGTEPITEKSSAWYLHSMERQDLRKQYYIRDPRNQPEINTGWHSFTIACDDSTNYEW